MPRVCALLASGLEEVECLSVVDILRRGGVETELVSVSGERVVTGSQRIAIVTDRLLEEVDPAGYDLIFLPGGVPGVPNLEANPAVKTMLLEQARAGRRIGAICAAPSILGHYGLLSGKRFTCYPGWQEGINDAEWTGEGVVSSGRISTSRGLGFALDFGLELLRLLMGEESFQKVRKGIQHPGTI